MISLPKNNSILCQKVVLITVKYVFCRANDLACSDGGVGADRFVCVSMTQVFSFQLKEYYEIVGESRPLSEIFPTHADFFTEMHF